MKRLFPAWPLGFSAAAAILCLGLAVAAAPAKTPDSLVPTDRKTPAATAPAPSDLASMRHDLLRKLEAARSSQDLAGPGDAEPVKFPDQKEARQYRQLQDTLVYLYQIQVETIAELQDALQQLDAAQARTQAWTGFDQPPPYSVLMVDELREAAEAAQGKLATHESTLVRLQRESLLFEQEAGRDEAAARLLEEALDRAQGPAELARAKAELTLARLRDRVSENRLAWSTLDTRLTRARSEIARAEAGLLGRQIRTAVRHTVFTAEDLEKVKHKLGLTQEKFEQEEREAAAELDRWARERDKARQALTKAEAAAPDSGAIPESTALEIPRARIGNAETWLQTLRFRSHVLQSSSALVGHLLVLWEQRHVLSNSTDPPARRKALAALRAALDRLRPLESYLYGEIDLVRADEIKQTARIDELISGSGALRDLERSTLDAYRAKREDLEHLQILAHRTTQALQRWVREYEEGFQGLRFDEKLLESLAQTADLGRKIWRYELFTVDDSVEIDGKPVAVTRGITFGKSVGAILLLLFGYWLSALLARRVQRIFERRFHVDAPQANVFRRWVLFILTLILLVSILNFVRIPLTVFAFLGGALAIGVGFGTQTLLKNLISGVMVLLEHKIKVGDIVEVDGVVGKVTEVDIRSSTVRGFDGVETMVPNSTFLEQKVTNWTYSNPRIRRSVRVGVTYGSPVRRVAEILGECASRHGLILQDPAPYVWFEDFGDNALVFGVYYWLEMHPNVNSNQVASDLRFMLEKRFGDEGIVVAFPQRDIHFSMDQPVRVELAESPAAVPAQRDGNRAMPDKRPAKPAAMGGSGGLP